MMSENNDNMKMEGAETCQSNLCIILDNLQSMFECYLRMTSRKAKEAWMLAFSIEVALVTMKLRAMRERWKVYLPFHEMIDVQFEERKRKAESWLSVLGDDSVEKQLEYEELIPDVGYLLDLIGCPVEPIRQGLNADELRQAVVSYCKKVDKLLKSCDVNGWEQQVMNRVEDDLQRLIKLLDNEDATREVCVLTVRALAEELNKLDEFFWSDLKEEQYMVLANRLMHRDCQEAVKKAHDRVRREHSTWPRKFEKMRAVAMKDQVKMKLMMEARGEELKEYIDLDYPNLLGDACFGQFLFKARHELTGEQVKLMVFCCTMIDDLNQYIDPKFKDKKLKEEAFGRVLDNEEKAIVKRLLALVEKVDWRGGATASSIAQGINKMLGVGFQLEGEMQVMSEQLWKLLKTRRNCDAEKSMQVTWLNIVGWCETQRFLTGGNPALCRKFFPRCGEDDYKAIDKGRAGEPASFRKIWPLLEKFLK